MKAKTEQQKQQQLLAKLTHIKDIAELKKIYLSVEEQNSTLRSDVVHLNYKVGVLKEKQSPKHQLVTPQDAAKIEEINSAQLELKGHYKIMQQLKKRRDSQYQSRASEELTTRYLQVNNQVAQAQKQIKKEKRQLCDLKKATVRLQKSIKQEQEDMSRNQPKIKEFDTENTQLKKRIMSLRKLGTQKEHEASKIMNSMYSFKNKYHQNQEYATSMEKVKLHRKSQSVSAIADPAQADQLQREVLDLRKRVEATEQSELKRSLIEARKRQQLTQSNKIMVKQQKQLEQKKVRLQRELNKYQKNWEKYLQFKKNYSVLKEYVATLTQVEEELPSQPFLRRDFAGLLGGKVQFDDRLVLKDNKKAFMVGLYAWEMEHQASAKTLLVALKAIYDNQEANHMNSVPLPGSYLSKCKMSKFTLVQGDFIKLFKVKYSAHDNRILKVEVRTNRNNRYEFGDRRQFSDLMAGQNVYGFDIAIGEYPTSLFGSYHSVRSHWYMESVGVEVAELQ